MNKAEQEKCPKCQSGHMRKIGVRNGKQRFGCNKCSYSYTENSSHNAKQNRSKKCILDLLKSLSKKELTKAYKLELKPIKENLQIDIVKLDTDSFENGFKTLENLGVILFTCGETIKYIPLKECNKYINIKERSKVAEEDNAQNNIPPN